MKLCAARSGSANKNLRWMLERKNEYLRQTRKRAVRAEQRVAESSKECLPIPP